MCFASLSSLLKIFAGFKRADHDMKLSSCEEGSENGGDDRVKPECAARFVMVWTVSKGTAIFVLFSLSRTASRRLFVVGVCDEWPTAADQ